MLKPKDMRFAPTFCSRMVCLAALLVQSCISAQLDYVFDKAFTAQTAGQEAEAITLYRELLAQDPTSDGAWHNLGVVFLVRGDFVNAVEAFDRAIELNPRNLLGHYLLALSLLQAGQWSKAREEVRETRKLRESMIAQTVTRLGMPSYDGIDLRVIGSSFDDKLTKIERASVGERYLSGYEATELAFVARPVSRSGFQT